MPYPARSLEERFWDKVNKLGPILVPKLGRCWVWTGGGFRNGYGAIREGGKNGGKQLKAHRVSWRLHFGPIPAGVDVLHRCDNPPCVRPSHLFLGDVGGNARDREDKKRGRNSRKTHCKNGHEFTLENTIVTPSGARNCLICTRKLRREAMARYKARHGL
jgi:hypothetical protein